MSLDHAPPEAPPARALPVSRGHAHCLLEQMLRIRRFEEKSAELYSAEKIRGFLHLYIGEEAIAAGAMAGLEPGDNVLSTYREHGHALARGVPAGAIMAEMYGKQEGCSRGRGGSMHLFDAARRFYGGSAIVGGHLPLAVGMAMAERDRVTACFFGEGAMAEGAFHEAMNLASLWRLPVLFVCENNLYAMGTALERSEAVTDLVSRARSYGVTATSVDGMDVLAVEAAVRRAAAAIRGGAGPWFLECRTYRFRAHSMFDAQLYRDKAEVERWRRRDPLALFRQTLREQDMLSDEDDAAIEARVTREIDEAVAFAEAGTWEPTEELYRDVITPVAAPPGPPAKPVVQDQPRTLTAREASREAIREALRSDDRAFLMGEDVGRYGGCFAVSMGLLEEFGPDRVRDTPLSEAGFVGAGIGAALAGMRPVIEIMTVNFSLLALDQILNNAATLRHMSGGQLSVPLVIRMATGGGKQLAAQHSHSFEGWFAHIPGLRVVAPATVEDFRGMLWSALMDPDPVLIFENTLLYNESAELPPGAGPVDLDRARVRRRGRDVSIFAWSACLPKAMKAADELASQGIEAEVVDLRTLRPLDEATILGSVRHTRRAVVVDEGWRSGGLSAEVAARITEGAFYELDAPVARVCTAEVPLPYARHMEQAALPQVPEIVAAARRLVEGRDA